jgi:hypothetical protein
MRLVVVCVIYVMAWTTSLRLEIVEEFTAYAPSPWRLLTQGWLLKPSSYWSEDSGEYISPRVVSATASWRSALRQQQLRRENIRVYQKMKRSSNRREAIKKRRYCAQCLQELNHTGKQNVRKFCSDSCYKTYWGPEQVLERMKSHG